MIQCRHILLLALVVYFAPLSAVAQPAHIANIDVFARKTHVRLIIATPEKIGYSAALKNGDLLIDFDQKLTGDFSLPVGKAPDLFLAAKHRNDTSKLRYGLIDGARIATSQSKNVIAVDIYSPTHTGPLRSIITNRELTRYRVHGFFASRAPSLKGFKVEPAHLATLQAEPAALAETEIISAPVGEDFDFAPIFLFETFRARARTEGFATLEQNLLGALANEPVRYDAARNLIYFYMAHGLHAEALSIIRQENQSRQFAELTLLEGVANFNMGRWVDAVDALNHKSLENNDAATAWRGAAHANLGAFEKAAKDLFNDVALPVPYESHAADYFIARAETGLDQGVLAETRAALAGLRSRSLNARQRAERRLIEARLLAASGREGQVQNDFQQLAVSAPAPVAQRAFLEAIRHQVATGALRPHAAGSKIDVLMLTWSGGTVERDALFIRGQLFDQEGNIADAFRARRRLTERHPQADTSRKAQKLMSVALTSLFSEPSLSPITAAQIFYENIDLAPPGKEGDALIRDVVDELIALDLTSEAAELLRHQVFERLRGPFRAAAAADLAALYLDNDQPSDALYALQSTRLTRLPATVQDKRRWLKARALVATNKAEQAVSLLAEDDSPQALQILGDLHWSNAQWEKAGHAYAKAIAPVAGETMLDKRQTSIAVRAAASYSLAGDETALSTFVGDIGSKLTDTAAKALLGALSTNDFSEDPSAFLTSYDDYFRPFDTGS